MYIVFYLCVYVCFMCVCWIVRQKLVQILRQRICMNLDERTVLSSIWILDHILKCLVTEKYISFSDMIETYFGCVIVYHMYIYNKYPSKHFYCFNFEHVEFWSGIFEIFFNYYAKLYVMYINDAVQETDVFSSSSEDEPLVSSLINIQTNNNNNCNKKPAKILTHALLNEIIGNKEQLPSSSSSTPTIISNLVKGGHSSTPSLTLSETSKSKLESPIKIDTNDIIIDHKIVKKSKCLSAQKKTQFYLSPIQVTGIQQRFKTLIISISKNVFSKNYSSCCFIGCHLLSFSIPNEYQTILSRIYASSNS